MGKLFTQIIFKYKKIVIIKTGKGRDGGWIIILDFLLCTSS